MTVFLPSLLQLQIAYVGVGYLKASITGPVLTLTRQRSYGRYVQIHR